MNRLEVLLAVALMAALQSVGLRAAVLSSDAHPQSPVASTMDAQPACSQQPPTHASQPPLRTWAEINALPSTFNANLPDYAYTVIVSVYNRPDTLERLVTALLAQTHAPTSIWISCFASPLKQQYSHVISRLRQLDARVEVINGSPQLSYYARWQLALSVRTPHVAILDDDMIPGNDSMRFLLHMMHLRSREYYGFLAACGHRIPVEARGSSMQFNPILHWSTRPYTAQPVDIAAVGMLRTEWVRFVWMEPPIDWTTADDIHVPHTLRVYGGIPTFVVPVVEADPSTWPMSTDVVELSAKGATTQGDAEAVMKRIIVSWRLHLRGRLPVRAHEMWGETRGLANVLAIVPHASAASAWQPWWTSVFGSVPARGGGAFARISRGLVVGIGRRDGGAPELDSIAAALHVNWTYHRRIVGVWNLELDGEPGIIARARMSALLAAVRPALVLVDSRLMDGAPHAHVIHDEVQSARIPLLDVARVLLQCQGPLQLVDDAQQASCISHAVQAALCQCQQSHSRVGAFVRCDGVAQLLSSAQPTFEIARDFGNQSVSEAIAATLN